MVIMRFVMVGITVSLWVSNISIFNEDLLQYAISIGAMGTTMKGRNRQSNCNMSQRTICKGRWRGLSPGPQTHLE